MIRRFSPIAVPLLGAVAVLCAGCKQPEIRVYTIPKQPPAVDTHSDEPATSEAPRPKPALTYALPPGWQETTPGEVSVAGFVAKGDGGEASITVTPLPDLKGREDLVVNMYRQQAGLPPLEPGELGKTLTPVPVAGGDGQLLEITGNSQGKPVRILTAIAHREGRSWFYRIAGDDAFVTAQKPAFLNFLTSVRINDVAAEGPAASAEPSPKFSWPVPEGWTPLPPGQMQVAKFAVPERDGGKAEVAVSTFPGDTGGMLANVNRWRKQLGLPETDDAGLAEFVSPLAPDLPGAALVSLSNGPRAMLGAVVPRSGDWWFYKMVGEVAAVNAARDAFVSFAQAQP